MPTPMMEQYNKIKKQYKDCILLFRLGDFYEGFHDDAKQMSKVLGIALTGRGKGETRHDMAGIPYHALKQYLPKLVKAGLKVAIAEQMEEAQQGKIVERDVVRVITAGTLMEEDILDSDNNNYIASIYLVKKGRVNLWGLSYADVSTGEFKVAEYTVNSGTVEEIPNQLITEYFRVRPSESLIPRAISDRFNDVFPNQGVTVLDDSEFLFSESKRILQENMKVASLKGFGIEDLIAGVSAAGALYSYLLSTQKTELNHINQISQLNSDSYMLLDQATIRNLELIYPLSYSKEKHTFFDSINECRTPMGQRLLRQWILRPLIKENNINNRLNSVSELVTNTSLNQDLISALANITDMERVLGRVATRSGNARDMVFLKDSLESSLQVFRTVKASENEILAKHTLGSDLLQDIEENVVDLINKSIKDEPAATITEGNIIKPGFNSDLDEIKEMEINGKAFIKKLQEEEIKKTGITSLKVKFNKVFGYYLEVSKSNIDKVPEHYIRKQTLVNAERYITDELKTWEDRILGAEDKAAQLEYKLFEEIRTKVLKYIDLIQKIIAFIAEVDVLSSFAKIAYERNYVKPDISEDLDNSLIINGRHPVVEQSGMDDFIPNDSQFNNDNMQVIILTGPNMSGKSTYIRQNALIFLMAQIGSFVPAQTAKLSIVDRIFTRVGASDNLAGGESTFMVEMNETANILNNATEKSLLILDEVGRGTSTYDGVAIAWAIVEHIASQIKAKTLFATHYHELMQLEGKYENVKNFNVDVKEVNGKVLFMRKIIQGGTDQSYGIHVAEIAGVPKKIINRANQILSTLEKEQKDMSKSTASLDQLSFGSVQPQLQIKKDDKLRDQIKELDIDLITPLDALNKLKELKDYTSRE